MIGDAIKYILSSVTDNVFGLHIPRNRGSRWVLWSQISRVPSGYKDAASAYDSHRFQIDVYDKTESNLYTFAEQIKTALDRYSGTVEGVVIDNVFFQSESYTDENLESETDNPEKYYRCIQEYIFWIRV